MILEKPKRVKDQDYLAFVKLQPCILFGRCGHVCSGPVEPHHVTPKMGGKVGSKVDDKRALPFCRGLHGLYHFLGSIEAFEQRFPVILEYEILKLNRLYQAPKFKEKAIKPKVLYVAVQCQCFRTHKFSLAKFNNGSFQCPVLRTRVDIA